MDKLELLLIVDPHPTVSAVLNDRTDGVYLLPSTTQMECVGLGDRVATARCSGASR